MSISKAGGARPNAGRKPKKYDRALLPTITRLWALGNNLTQIAFALGICENIFARWRKEHPEIEEEMARARLQANADVAESMFRQAVGFTYQEEELVKYSERDKNGNRIDRYEVVKVTKHKPPSYSAAQYWLENRDSENWHNHKTLKHVVQDARQQEVREALELVSNKTRGLPSEDPNTAKFMAEYGLSAEPYGSDTFHTAAIEGECTESDADEENYAHHWP